MFQKIETFNGSAFTTNKSVFRSKTFEHHPIVLDGIYITNLIPKLHAQFAIKLGQTYEAQAPVNLFNTTMDFGRVHLNTQNEVLAGHLTKYYGVLTNPGTSYTITGPYNGKEFYDLTFIRQNTDIDNLRCEFRSNMDFWRTASLVCVVGGVVCGVCEVVMTK